MAAAAGGPPPYPPLVPVTSRWISLPNDAKATDPVAKDKFNLLIYIKDLAKPNSAYSTAFTGTDTDHSGQDGEDYAMGGTRAGGRVGRRETRRRMLAADPNLRALRKAVREALRQAARRGIDYRTGPDGKTVLERVAIDGNPPAKPLLDELDALVRLGRTVYDRPTELTNWFRPTLVRHLDGNLHWALGGSNRKTLERAMDFVDNWAQARYRFFDHAVRDDPGEYLKVSRRLNGDAANRLVHDADFLGDSDIMGCTWFRRAPDRNLFEEVYKMDLARARLFKHSLADSRDSYREFFLWLVEYINVYNNWRRELLRAHELNGFRPSARGLHGTALDNARANYYRTLQGFLSPHDNRYKDVLDAAATLATEAINGIMQEGTWRTIIAALNALNSSIRDRGDRVYDHSRYPLKNYPTAYSTLAQGLFRANPRQPTPLDFNWP